MKWNLLCFALVFCTTSAWTGASENRAADAVRESQLVHDLRAVRNGNKVTLTWSQPVDSENAQSFPQHLATARLCRNISLTVSNSGIACTHEVKQVHLEKPVGFVVSAAHTKTNVVALVQLVDTLSEDQDDWDQLRFAVYQLEFRDDRGRKVGVSNSVAVPLAPVPLPRGLHSELDARGVYLIWEEEVETRSPQCKFDYRVYRQEKGSAKRVTVPYLRAVIHTPEGERWTAVDTGMEWEKTYLYSIKPISRVYSQGGRLIVEIEGDDSASLEVVTHDIFAPSAPERLLAIVGHASGEKFVDLLWAPNTEKDFSGYNVYRYEEGREPQRINPTPTTMLSFQDTNVSPGHRYFYCISAVDVQGNESARSKEAVVAVP